MLKSERLQKDFGIIYISFVCLMWGITLITSYPYNWKSAGFIILAIQFLLNVYTLFLILFINFETIKRLLPIYIIVVSILTFPNLVHNCAHKYNDSLLFTIVNMVSLAVFYYGERKSIIWNCFIILWLIVGFIVAEIWGEELLRFFDEDENLHHTFGNNYILNAAFIVSMTMVILCARYLIYKARYEETLPDYDLAKAIRSDVQYFELYEKIIRCFDEKKPYLDSTFSISSLADYLDCNPTYISRAIKVHKKINFAAFVNMYRVKRAIELMQEDNEKKYTLQYIYQGSGFQSQTTFNRVFKQTTGFTPSDYLQQEK